MAIMYALIMLMMVSLFVAAAIKEKAETVFPCTLLMVIAVLYPFYCLDRLLLGRIMVYTVLIAAVVISVGVLMKDKRPLIRCVWNVLTPGVFIYALLCAFFFIFCRHNLVGLWDEMRLWGAVPKALYATQSLQLGSEALIFEIMQAYPPGIPLLVYFMESLSPTFSEGYIFIVYGIFFSAMLLPMLRNLKWRHWPVFLPLTLLIAYAPCLFTSHGGDEGWFYESLFIDPVLGALGGYAFYLSAMKPFANRFSTLRFCVALMVLPTVKESGALFALIAGCNAIVLFALENKPAVTWKTWLRQTIQLSMPIAFGYVLWKYMLSVYEIRSNEAGSLRLELPWDSIVQMWTKLTEMPMLVLYDPLLSTEVTLTYIPCILILLGVSILCVKRGEQGGSPAHFVTWAAMIASFGVFLIGYRLSFQGSLPSFQRYVSTTLFVALVFVLLYGIPLLLERIPSFSLKRLSGKKVLLAAASIVIMLSFSLSLYAWSDKKYDMQYTVAPTKAAVSKVLKNAEGSTEDPANLYLLISQEPRRNSLIHHRIYFELLGTNVCVRNFWNDVNIVGGEETPEDWTWEEIISAAEQWAEKLRSAGYDYIYVVSVNDFSLEVLAQFGITQAVAGDLYAVENVNGEIRLVRA